MAKPCPGEPPVHPKSGADLKPGVAPEDGVDPEDGATDGAADDDFAEKIATTTAFLEQVRDDYDALAQLSHADRKRFLMAAGQVARPGTWAKRELSQAARERRKASKRAKDKRLLDVTGIRQSRRQQVFVPWQYGSVIDRTGDGGVTPNMLGSTAPLSNAPAPEPARLCDEVHCYVCKAQYRELHFFYDALCPSCAELNWNKRSQTVDLGGRVAVITGARVKIGFQAALMLLRAGAHVIVTTRFPRDAATRYQAEEDFGHWGDRLEIFGLDLRHTPSVEAFAQFLAGHLERLDFLINNACQTVRRPVGFYDHLVSAETKPGAALPEGPGDVLDAYEKMRGERQLSGTRGALLSAADAMGLRDSVELSQLALLEEDLERSTHIFPAGQLDADQQQVDLRDINSWRLPLADVTAVELLEVQLVNAVAPFILNARLKTIMLRHPDKDRHIVNVSAVEGQFSRRLKTDKHPHTNMAKAALNMMTRTSAADYVREGIHMNSVDTGWVTDEDPAAIAERKTREQGFHPPLDIVDGAARIVDPIFSGIRSGKHVWGAFLKDYEPTDW
jgi:NAD(P)-dependent dehydrogenase (short-subunit alcohol dehydrogenase family)